MEAAKLLQIVKVKNDVLEFDENLLESVFDRPETNQKVVVISIIGASPESNRFLFRRFLRYLYAQVCKQSFL